MDYSIAIVGSKETILGFKALGVAAVPVSNVEQALAAMESLKEETTNGDQPKYAIIFIMEELAKALPRDRYEKLSKDALPAIIPLPGVHGATGFGLTRLSRMVEQAVGSDIFGE